MKIDENLDENFHLEGQSQPTRRAALEYSLPKCTRTGAKDHETFAGVDVRPTRGAGPPAVQVVKLKRIVAAASPIKNEDGVSAGGWKERVVIVCRRIQTEI